MAPSPSETQPLLRAPVPYNPPSRLTRARRPKTNTCTRFIAITTPWILLYLIYNIIFEPDFTWLKQSFITRSYIGLPHKNWPNVNANVPFSELENIALTYPSADRAREWSRYYTSGPHLGGKNLSQALWTKARFEEFGFKTEIATYEIYVNYPVSHRMALLKEKKGKEGKRGQLGKRTKEDYKVLYEAKLEEPVIDEDETSGLEDRIPTFHGYSAR